MSSCPDVQLRSGNMSSERGSRLVPARDRNPAIKLGEAQVQGLPGAMAVQQRKRRRGEGEEGDSDSEIGSAGKRSQHGIDVKEPLRGRGDERKDDDLSEAGAASGHGSGVTNEDIMSVLRSIKDSLAGLNALRSVPTTSSTGSTANIQHVSTSHDNVAGLSAMAISASEEALGSLLKRAGDQTPGNLLMSLVPPQGTGNEALPAHPHKSVDDLRIARIGQVSDETHWDALDHEAVEEVFKEMWAAMHPTIALAEGDEEPAGAAVEGKRTQKRPLTLQAKKKYIRRNIKVALEGVRSKLQVGVCGLMMGSF